MRILSNTWRRDLAALFLAICLLFAIGLAAHAYITPSEARYIEIPRQILATHDWLTPRLNGVPYFEKPPLFYWMQAAVLGLLGTGEFAGRLATALLATLTCLVTYVAGRMLYGRLAGLLSATVLATSLLGYGLSRVALLDVPVGFFITLTMACFIIAERARDKTRRRNFYLLMYAASALAVMTKGLIGMVIPGLVIGAWIALTKRWRILREAQLPLGILVFLAIAAPWHVLMAEHHPEFLNFYFVHEHFDRFVSEGHHRTAPWWFFLAVSLAGLLPWTGLLPAAARQLQRREAFDQLLLVWIVLPLLFFSASESKLLPYIYPVFPPLSILLGRTLADLWEEKLPPDSLKRAGLFVIILFTAVVLGAQLLPTLPGKLGHALSLLEYIRPMMLAPIALAIIVLWFAVIGGQPAKRIILLLAAFGVTTDISINFMASRFTAASVRPLVRTIASRLQPDDTVVAYGSYWQDLPVYANRNVTVAGWTGELSFGVEHYPETHQWMISTDDFWKRCPSYPHHLYVFMLQETYGKLTPPANCRLQVVANYGKTLLLSREQR